MVDMVVHRRDMKATLSRLCGLLMNDAAAVVQEEHPELPFPVAAE